jgi:polysaccharide export outer membrane protein
MSVKILILSILASVLTGCGLPEAGPKAATIVNEAARRTIPPFALVDVNSAAIVRTVARPEPSLAATFGNGSPNPGVRIAVGDVVSVSLWEAPPGSLFGNSTSSLNQQQPSGSAVTIPPQMINNDRTISVPYAGRVVAAGRTPAQVEQLLVSALNGKAIQPQALVTVQQSTANTVTVTGEVAGGARVPLSPAGERILDAIASAGGLRAGVNDSVVYLTRNAITKHIDFQRIVQSPRENVRLRAGDVVTVVREPKTFTILGATGQNAEVSFNAQHVTMANAVARVGGLLDNRADAAGVFLFRYETPEVARRIVAPNNPVLRRAGPVPVVYRFNLKNPGTMLAVQQFEVQPGDIVYVANASGIDLQKFLSLFQGVSGQALSAASVGITAAAAN